MRGYFFCAVLAMFSSTAAVAETWARFARTSDLTMDMDTDSVTRKGALVAVWVKSTVLNPAKPYLVAGKRVDFMLDRWIINCAERTNAYGPGGSYKKDGSVVTSSRGDPNDFDDIVPGSGPDRVRTIVCSNSQ